MNSARVTFEKKEQTVEAGRKAASWTPFYTAWADFPAFSVKEQTTIHHRSLADAVTLEVRICNEVREILRDLRDFRVLLDGQPYTLVGADKSRKRPGWERLLAARAD